MSRPLTVYFPSADRNPEKYLNKILGRTDIEDALSRLDKLTQEEARMATVEVLKVAHHIEEGVKTVSDNVKNVDEKVNVAIDGTLSIKHLRSSSPAFIPYLTRRQGNKGSSATDG